MHFFNVYQYAAPLVLLPLAYWLWLQRCAGEHRLAALALAIPVLFAYIVPAIGTNVLRIWEFNTRLRLGRFRPHHDVRARLLAHVVDEARPPAADTHDPVSFPQSADRDCANGWIQAGHVSAAR